jgi:threonine aldolase
MIDLRSDTVTKPSPAMRQTMANAEVGDDVYGEDPTINKLEERAAEVFGRQAAILVPTGSMGNLIAARIHTQHGQEVICESRAHILDWEMAMVAAFCGCIPRTVVAERGILTWAHVKPALSPKIYYRAQTGLIWCENTANIAGGTVMPLDVCEEIWAGAKAAGLPVHLDGARVFNAATALGVSVADLTSGFDTVMFCLSKGLGAPVGSMLVGSEETIAQARVFRKALGGGMRQAGVLAAAGLIALEEGPKRLHEDHANARLLAEALADAPGVEIDLAAVETNIVIFKLTDGNAAGFVAEFKRRGVLASAIGPDSVRFVTHCDVSRPECEKAAALSVEVLGALVAR